MRQEDPVFVKKRMPTIRCEADPRRFLIIFHAPNQAKTGAESDDDVERFEKHVLAHAEKYQQLMKSEE
jgi:hypothetical protein